MRWLIILVLFMCSLSCKSQDIYPFVNILNKPCIKPISGYQYETCGAMIVDIDDQTFIVPRHFNSDLASIPRWYWPILSPRHSKLVYPGILHDYLYSCPANLSREYTDRVLFSALISEGVSRYTAYKMYYAVRLFGASHFKSDNYCISRDFEDMKK